MSLLHLHAWETVRAERTCEHPWTGPDLGGDVVAYVPRPRAKHPSPCLQSSAARRCEARLYQQCTKCGDRRMSVATQNVPRPAAARDLWVEQGVLPTEGT